MVVRSSWLPKINASLNAAAAVLLGTGYVLIRRRDPDEPPPAA